MKTGDFFLGDTCLESSLSQHLSNQELPTENIIVDIKQRGVPDQTQVPNIVSSNLHICSYMQVCGLLGEELPSPLTRVWTVADTEGNKSTST